MKDDDKVIDLLPLIAKRKEQFNDLIEEETPEPDHSKKTLLMEYDHSYCSFQLMVEGDNGEVLEITPRRAAETVYRLFEIAEVLVEEFDLDI